MEIASACRSDAMTLPSAAQVHKVGQVQCLQEVMPTISESKITLCYKLQIG